MENKRRARSGLKKRIVLIVIILEIWAMSCGMWYSCTAETLWKNPGSTSSTEGTNSVNGNSSNGGGVKNEPPADPSADPEQEGGEQPDADPEGAPQSSLDTGSKSGDYTLKIAPAAPVFEEEPFIGEDIDPDEPDNPGDDTPGDDTPGDD